MKGKLTPGAHVDLGLAILGVVNQPRVPLTQVDIAYVCGCSRQCIEQIEKKALRKIRVKLRFANTKNANQDHLWRELMDELFNRRSVAQAMPKQGARE